MSDTSKRNGLLPNNLPARRVVTNNSEMEKIKGMLKNLNQLHDDVKQFRALP